MMPFLYRLAAMLSAGMSTPFFYVAFLAIRDTGAPVWLLTEIIAAGVGWLIAAVLLWDRSFWRRRG